jgi:D-serine deaminase-like pyridoxal phosphate-dependent protein
LAYCFSGVNYYFLDEDVFMNTYDLETPSILVDIERTQRNITRMQAQCDKLGLKLRAHVTTHKIPDIARLQLDGGALGIASQKVSEAELFAEAGFNDILIPYNIVGTQKTNKLADLALFNRVTVSVDHVRVIDMLAEAAKADEMSLRILVELATDIGRTGARIDEIVTLAERIEEDENLHFAGLLVYAHNALLRPMLQDAVLRLSEAGIGVDVVSGGGTLLAAHAQDIPELTELRVGTYVFNDWGTVAKGAATLDDCTLHVMATVVSRPTENRAVLDCGSNTLSGERYGGYYGYVVEYPMARIYALHAEHAMVDLSACDDHPVIGDRVHVIPVSAAAAINLTNFVYGTRGSELEVEWQVSSRGSVW